MILKMTLDTPDGPVERDLDRSTLMASEAVECEKLTGWTHSDWWEALVNNKAQATLFAWWLACKRAGKPAAAKFSALDIDLAKLVFDWSLSPEEEERAEKILADQKAAEDADKPVGPTGVALAATKGKSASK